MALSTLLLGFTARDISPFRAVLWLALGLISLATTRVLVEGYRIRSKYKLIKAQGIPLLPHSWLLGHLLILRAFQKEFPADINFNFFHLWFVQNYKRWFPQHSRVPAVVYLDLWPAVKFPLLFSYKPAISAQFTSIQNLDKHQIAIDFMSPLTFGKDLSTMQGDEWKKWRNLFNTGFSARNIAAMMPELIEETEVFVQSMQAKAGGPDGTEWGPVFTLKHYTGALTFDIIVRSVLDRRLHDQTFPDGTPLRMALGDQMRLAALGQAFSLARLSPMHKAHVRRNNKIIYDALIHDVYRGLDEIEKQSAFQKKTVLSLAMKQLVAETGGDRDRAFAHPDLIDIIMGSLKVFLAAGHDTSSMTLCFAYKLLQDHPECMAKMRQEHDQILGPDPDAVAQVLRESPYLLNSLVYTNAVLKETLRLSFMGSTMRKSDSSSFVLTDPDTGIQYPTFGFMIWDGTSAIHYDPALWDRPRDFVPERWLVGPDEPHHPVKDSFRAFGRGPRDCIGKELAIVEIKLALAFTARKFDIEQAWDKWDAIKSTD